jgi:hypothetical protein
VEQNPSLADHHKKNPVVFLFEAKTTNLLMATKET